VTTIAATGFTITMTYAAPDRFPAAETAAPGAKALRMQSNGARF